jgi:hypothetical protein
MSFEVEFCADNISLATELDEDWYHSDDPIKSGISFYVKVRCVMASSVSVLQFVCVHVCVCVCVYVCVSSSMIA